MKSDLPAGSPSCSPSQSASSSAGISGHSSHSHKDFLETTFATEFCVIFADGTLELSRGYYWRMKIGQDFGMPHGPFASLEGAKADADLYFQNQITRILHRIRK